MSPKLNSAIAVVGIDIGKNSSRVVGPDRRGATVLRRDQDRRTALLIKPTSCGIVTG
jgi:transposase